MSKPLTDKLQEHVLKAILLAPKDVIEEYKLQFIGMPIEVSRLAFFHPSNREEWVNAECYREFICHKLSWSGDHFASGTSAERFWRGLRSQRTQLQIYPTWRDAVADDSEPVQPSKDSEVIVISSDSDEEAISEIVRRLQRRKKAKEVIVISSDSDEPLVDTIVPRKRKAQPRGGSSQGASKKRTKIRIFEPEAIIVLDSDEEMTVVA